MAFKITAESEEKTAAYAAVLSNLIEEKDVLLLDGDLGAGKTFFSRALLKSLGVQDSVISPTFVIVREYENRIPIYHADLYRISPEEFFALGYLDVIESQGVFVIEWGSKIADFLENYLLIDFEILSLEARSLNVKGFGARGEMLAGKWHKNIS